MLAFFWCCSTFSTIVAFWLFQPLLCCSFGFPLVVICLFVCSLIGLFVVKAVLVIVVAVVAAVVAQFACFTAIINVLAGHP